MRNSCNNCKFIRKLKHNFIPEYGFEDSYCCIVNEDKYTYVQEIDRSGSCDLFCLKDGINY